MLAELALEALEVMDKLGQLSPDKLLLDRFKNIGGEV